MDSDFDNGGDDRRREDRVAVFELCDVGRPEDRIMVEVRDLSRGGLRVCADRPLEEHMVVHVHVPYNPLGVPLRAVVVRSRILGDGRCEAGLEFLNMGTDEAALVAAHLDAIEEARMEGTP